MNFPKQIYMIRHNITGRIYIGSSATPQKRYENHLCRLKNGKHSIEDLQKDFNEYGENFTFTILDEIADSEETAKEYQWMKELKSNIRGIGYNYNDKARKLISEPEKAQPERKPTKEERMIEEIISLLEAIKTDYDTIEFVFLFLQKTIARKEEK